MCPRCDPGGTQCISWLRHLPPRCAWLLHSVVSAVAAWQTARKSRQRGSGSGGGSSRAAAQHDGAGERLQRWWRCMSGGSSKKQMGTTAGPSATERHAVRMGVDAAAHRRLRAARGCYESTRGNIWRPLMSGCGATSLLPSRLTTVLPAPLGPAGRPAREAGQDVRRQGPELRVCVRHAHPVRRRQELRLRPDLRCVAWRGGRGSVPAGSSRDGGF